MTPQDWERLLEMIRNLGLIVAGVDYKKGTILIKVPGVPSTRE